MQFDDPSDEYFPTSQGLHPVFPSKLLPEYPAAHAVQSSAVTPIVLTRLLGTKYPGRQMQRFHGLEVTPGYATVLGAETTVLVGKVGP